MTNLRNLLLIIAVLIVSNTISQSNKIDSKPLNILSMALTDHTIGTAFNFIVLKKTKKGSIKVIQILSTNTRSQKIIDSLFYTLNMEQIFSKQEKGNYCFPIFLAVDTNDGVPIWDNNSYANISRFSNEFKLPKYTILLKPYIIFSSPPIR